MTQQTLDTIHQCYLASLEQGKDLLTIITQLHELIGALEVDEADEEELGRFLTGLSSCISLRERTNDLTNFVLSLSTTLVYITIFMNYKKNKDWDVNIVARRKSLERDLTKVLRKSIENDFSGGIRDRFGLRIILLNDRFSTEELLFNELRDIYSTIEKIVCGTDLKLRKEFLDFVDTEVDNPLIKPQISTILRSQFVSEYFKDYLTNPKESNGYESLHFCLRVEFPNFFGGAIAEFQIRSQEMHKNAEMENGKWSHDKYEHETSDELAWVFHMPDEYFSKIKIAGFTSYEPNIGDLDGIGCEKILVNRRVSSSLVPNSNF